MPIPKRIEQFLHQKVTSAAQGDIPELKKQQAVLDFVISIYTFTSIEYNQLINKGHEEDL